MDNFYVTFGQQYRYNQHPAAGHPDGWFLIIAEDETDARSAAFKLMGDKWAFMYPESEFNKDYFPMGLLRTIDATKLLEDTNG